MKVLVLGAGGMVGSAVCRNLLRDSTYDLLMPTSRDLDLRDLQAVDLYFAHNKNIDAVIITAGKVGGILANASNPLDFFNINMAIASNSINTAAKYGVKKLIYLGSSCIYPREAPQPIKEEYLLTGSLEKTNEAYALAKICGVKLCEYYRQRQGLDYVALMPCNLYGPGDNYHPENSHVIPALLRKFHSAATEVTVWGSGKPRREFLHVADLADACSLMLRTTAEHYIYNVGYGSDVSISDLVNIVVNVTGFKGSVHYVSDKPDGTMLKLMDSNRIRSLGWLPRIALEKGLVMAYNSYLEELKSGTFRE